MANQSIPQSAKIIHGLINPCILGGPYGVFYVRDGKIGAQVTGIRTAQECDDHAREYARTYDAPIVSPMLCPPAPFVDVDSETAYGSTMRFSRAVRVF
jgi:hypothetical protein